MIEASFHPKVHSKNKHVVLKLCIGLVFIGVVFLYLVYLTFPRFSLIHPTNLVDSSNPLVDSRFTIRSDAFVLLDKPVVDLCYINFKAGGLTIQNTKLDLSVGDIFPTFPIHNASVSFGIDSTDFTTDYTSNPIEEFYFGVGIRYRYFTLHFDDRECYKIRRLNKQTMMWNPVPCEDFDLAKCGTDEFYN